MTEAGTKKRLSLPVQIVLCMALGILLGMWLGPSAESLGLIGKVVIDLIKCLAIPLVFFAIVEAIVTTNIPAKCIGRLFLVVVINASIACTIGLFLVNTVRPGESLKPFVGHVERDATIESAAKNSLNAIDVLTSHIPKSVVEPFVENDVLMVVLLSLLIGLALRRVAQTESVSLDKPLGFALKVCERMLTWVVHLVPLAVLGVTAKTVGQHGFGPLKGLMLYVGICFAGLALQYLLVYQTWIRVVAGMSLKKFWSYALKPVVYAFGTNSSLATLPLTLGALDAMDVDKCSSRLGACVGTNLNNDGILLYEMMAVILVAQAYGIDMTLAHQVGIAGLCVMAAIGVAGVPEAGVISLALVLGATNMPTELLPILLTVDWIVARARSVVNVLSDMTVSISIDALGKRAG